MKKAAAAFGIIIRKAAFSAFIRLLLPPASPCFLGSLYIMIYNTFVLELQQYEMYLFNNKRFNSVEIEEYLSYGTVNRKSFLSMLRINYYKDSARIL